MTCIKSLTKIFHVLLIWYLMLILPTFYEQLLLLPKKLQSQNVIRENLCKELLYEKVAHCTWNWHLLTIFPTFYEQLLHQFPYDKKWQTKTHKSCAKHYHTKKLLGAIDTFFPQEFDFRHFFQAERRWKGGSRLSSSKVRSSNFLNRFNDWLQFIKQNLFNWRTIFFGGGPKNKPQRLAIYDRVYKSNTKLNFGYFGLLLGLITFKVITEPT